MFPAVCTLLLLCAGALASPAANQYIDTVLFSSLQNELRAHSLDPAILSNFDTEFVDHVKIIGKVKGKANYTGGKLTGLSRVQRFSECLGPLFSFGATTINCTISFNFLNTEYEAKMKYGKLPSVNVKARANITTTLVHIVVASYPQNPMPTVKSFQFQQIGQIHPTFTGLGSALNKFLTILKDGYTSHVSAEIFNSISQRFQYVFSRAVSQVPMPLM